MGDWKSGSAEERRYAEASRALRQFLDAPCGDRPRVHVIGPVTHAARYNNAFRRVQPGEREDIVRLKAGLDVTEFVMIVDSLLSIATITAVWLGLLATRTPSWTARAAVAAVPGSW